jgi:hypothetical protein
MMHVFRVGDLKNALVLAAAAIASMGAIPSSGSSGVVATPWAFAPTPTRRVKHWFNIACYLLTPLVESIPHTSHM